jgi:acyl transferase domain-containing protein/3-hydroxymyristoyl/3-hydroxydecanoyl-(acyl carrier protein) dehydratase
MHPDTQIAIVGIGGLFPGAPTIDQFWENIRDGVDATREVPSGRWSMEPARAYDPRVAVPDKVHSIRGGFAASPAIDGNEFAIEPAVLKRLDPVFRLALHVAHQAWRDVSTEPVDRSRVGVVFGNIVLPTETASGISRELLGQAIEEKLGIPARPPVEIEPLNAFPAGLPAALIARAMGLGGAAYTLDAACASSLYALKLAIDEIQTGRADAMICGGVSRPDPLYTQMGFSQLRALSARGKPAPLDHRGDGLVVGEGAGMFVLKRLTDALAHGDHVYAIVAGIGLSNDIHGDLLAPSSEGQLRAMRMAYEQAGWSPREVDLIECHAAGTPVGDAVEAESLKSLWGKAGWTKQQCVIGSVKSNIGHALTAAGAAGLLKVLMSLKHQTLPPTANFERPAPRLGLDASPFRVLTQPEPWPMRSTTSPRRAAISGFGFGGINCHVLIEEWRLAQVQTRPAVDSRTQSSRTGDSATTSTAPIAIVGLAAHLGAFAGRDAFAERVLGYEKGVAAAPPRDGWGIADSSSHEHQAWNGRELAGYYIEALSFPVDRFRIPPTELSEMLPQQSLLLRVAADAIDDAGWDQEQAIRTGVLVGIGLDLNTTNFHLRWSLAERAREWSETLGLGLSADELARWTEDLRASAGPPLTANRTMGSLGGLIASRVAREFKIGGPSFTVSCDETSGIQALAIAALWLRRRELDVAVVGAVDFAGDLRTIIARHRLKDGAAFSTTTHPAAPGGGIASCACDGAVALVLKRLDDAERDGDHIYATVGDVTTGCGDADHAALGALPGREATAPMHTFDDYNTEEFVSIAMDLGHAGAATGLASVAKEALCLDRRVLPTDRAGDGPRFWMRNRAEGPRRARVSVSSLGANYGHVDLRESEEKPGAARAERRPPTMHTPGTARSEPRPPRRGAGLFAIEADDTSGLAKLIHELSEMARASSNRTTIDALAQQWWQRHPNDPQLRLGTAFVADGVESLTPLLDRASRETHGNSTWASEAHGNITRKRLAFVYPGLGNHFAGMGRALSALWPDVLRRHDLESGYLREQFDPRIWWNGELPRRFDDHRAPILGSVAVGAMVTDVLRELGVCPDAAIGYSLGESAALVALRAWTGRDELLRRLRSSPLFQTELAGPCDAARKLWGIPPSEPVDWIAGIVPRSVAAVHEAIARHSRVYALIRNTAEETVIGGYRKDVEAVVKALQCPFIELPTVSTVHCEIGGSVAAEYRAFHDLETTAPSAVELYSGAWGRSYSVDRQTAAEAVTAQASRTIDFPAVIERAYSDGIRVFVEVGPGASCTRLIDQILSGRPHVACSACRPDRDPLAAILDVIAQLIGQRLPVDLASLFGEPADRAGLRGETDRLGLEARRREVHVDVRGKAFQLPALPSHRATPLTAIVATEEPGSAETRCAPAQSSRDEPPAFRSPLLRSMHAVERASADAHQVFLRVAQGAVDLIGKHVAFQLKLIEKNAGEVPAPKAPNPPADSGAAPAKEPRAPRMTRNKLNRSQCLEFAVGSIGAVLGPEYAVVDSLPTRVRLPDEPLMLVDRIVSIEGRPRSLENGRVVTEHVIEPDAWYLDSGRIAPSIAIEAGQADLFLCGYLGVDFETKGLAVYRLLDATVTFHRGLPAAGAVIQYDIRITTFFRQGKTILFRFQFDATVEGKPLLTMRDGCAGFFTPEELAAGKGIVPRGPVENVHTRSVCTDVADLVPMARARLGEREVDSLRRGDCAEAFGPPFDGLAVHGLLGLPGGRMTLIDRVADLDPAGGPSGLGSIRAEADIHRGDWFMVCHFVDDRVMPGTLMYESCLHALRILMMRIGWIGPSGQAAYEPVPGIANRLKCRGQIVESTRVVTYEVAIKERGYRPEPYAIADAVILADGKPIVEVMDMGLQLAGMDRRQLEMLWAGGVTGDHAAHASNTLTPPLKAGGIAAALFDHDRILAFAIGKPSDAFGAPYRVFDEARFVARLPGPPYQFLDRITRIDAQPWVMEAGGSGEAQFDVDPDAWYFAADRQDRMPFAVLLEVALQSCGWMAAYMGSALASDGDLKFRNLGGTARQHRPVTRAAATLTTRFRVTRIARSAGMILQHYDFAVHDPEHVVYDGSAEFGFFQPSALEQQVGIREAALYPLAEEELSDARSFGFPSDAPFPETRWRMLESVDALIADGGSQGLGLARASISVDPEAWFFKAHFLNDPVWPGSLGLESLLQLLKVVAARRWGAGARSAFESPAIGRSHHWTYRGQIVPANERVAVEADIKVRDDNERLLVADGLLSVDGKVIYKMNDFSIRHCAS